MFMSPDNGDFELIKQMIKDFLIVFIYPVIVFLMKRVSMKNDKIQKMIDDHSVRIAVTESQVREVKDDIKEIKDSIDKLPERIKTDIKDILSNGKK